MSPHFRRRPNCLGLLSVVACAGNTTEEWEGFWKAEVATQFGENVVSDLQPQQRKSVCACFDSVVVVVAEWKWCSSKIPQQATTILSLIGK